MINKNNVPIQKDRDIDHDEMAVYCGFFVQPFVRESDLYGPTFRLNYQDIAFEGVSRTFVTTFAYLLQAFSNDMLESRSYPVNECLVLTPVLIDDQLAVRCTIRYHQNERSREELEEEVFLDKAEAFVVGENLMYAMEHGRTFTLRAS